MGKVRARSDNGKLFLDFYYQGVRCREQTALANTPANRRKVQKLLDRIESEIQAGSFDYGATFPGSARVLQFSGVRPSGGAADSASVPAQTGPAREVDRTPRFREFAETWMREKEPEWRPSYRETVSVTLNRYLLPAFGNRRVGSITRADLLDFRARIASYHRANGRKLSNARINKVMGFARQILDEAADRYEFPSPYRGIKTLRSRKPDIHPFSLEEVHRILDRIRPDYRHYLAVRFYTGMRSGEINGLRWHNVDFSNNLILVRETLVQGRLQEGSKTYDSNRDIPMLQPVREALEAQRKIVPKGIEWVFCTPRGAPIENRNFTNRVWKPDERRLSAQDPCGAVRGGHDTVFTAPPSTGRWSWSTCAHPRHRQPDRQPGSRRGRRHGTVPRRPAPTWTIHVSAAVIEGRRASDAKR